MQQGITRISLEGDLVHSRLVVKTIFARLKIETNSQERVEAATTDSSCYSVSIVQQIKWGPPGECAPGVAPGLKSAPGSFSGCGRQQDLELESESVGKRYH